MKIQKIPEASIMRLSVYSRHLAHLDQMGIVTTSSGEIAEGVGVSSAQVRKDLAYFGEFGTRGVGYNVKDLHHHILKILGLNNEWPIILIGAGNLGTALCLYRGFNERGFRIAGVFDNDIKKQGQMVGEITILPMEKLEQVIEEYEVKMGIVAVPSSFAQEIVNLMVKYGIKAIFNFAPRALSVPDDVELRNVDLAVNLEVLTFKLSI
ncbi:redox-sensing transcriptional repressor Rex [Dehalobacterium formicoaceticum]|uniref:Redox-sensing transcriptional repressor Rex n=1 Tax=Dehalobacterium formicoaceticum TaxID=51515 RepID=A0ABT1Y2A9_9FIRM|nr:redox-sensing transcriptional repressor Rex [Dehalobacterium formicoaceticum]MCR6545008.1 redox-sensing transcriptional repressor Rex [Dehalobacterium formicoaceticum]